MRTAANQAYLNTRVSIMATRLFDPSLVAALARQGLAELAERFALTPLLDERIAGQARGRAAEQALIQTLLSELTILVRPMAAAQGALVLDWGRKYALFNLKTLIRGKLYDLAPKEIRENLYDLPPSVRLPHQELFQAETVLELLRALERGPCRPIARQVREVYEQGRDPFAIEAAIDRHYYAGLVRQVGRLDDADRRPLQTLLGADLDRVALLWLLRLRFSYRLSPSEAFYRLVPSLRLLQRDRLLRLVGLEDFERVLESVPPPLDGLLAGSTNLLEVQKRMGVYLRAEALRTLRQGRSGVARALAYLILRELDLFRLFALLQGRLLALPQELVDIAIELAEPGCPLGGEASARRGS